MKYLVYAAFVVTLFCINSPHSSAQVGRRMGTSSEIAVPLELPPPEAAPEGDLPEGSVVECDCLRRPAADRPDGVKAEPAREEEAFRSNEVDERAVVTYAPDPTYTREARENGTSGRVILRVVLSATGQVSTVKVVEGLPDGLTATAVGAACSVEFKAARKGGSAVSQYATVEYNFDVDDRRFGPAPPMRGPLRVPSRTRMPYPRLPVFSSPAPWAYGLPPLSCILMRVF